MNVYSKLDKNKENLYFTQIQTDSITFNVQTRPVQLWPKHDVTVPYAIGTTPVSHIQPLS